jgi:hypothetical protein
MLTAPGDRAPDGDWRAGGTSAYQARVQSLQALSISPAARLGVSVDRIQFDLPTESDGAES